MITFFYSILFVLCVLLRVAFLTLLERKILSLVGLRLGPYKVSFLGALQPISDAGKLANKQCNRLRNFSIYFYYVSGISIFVCRVLVWRCFFVNPFFSFHNLRIIFFMLILSLSRINCIARGWRTFGKYTILGRLRSVAQLISYESALYFCLFFFFFFLESFRLIESSYFFFRRTILIFPFVLYIWLPCFLAELNRSPFDFSEGERELVSGFNTDLGRSSFTLVFLAEYSNILFFCFIRGYIYFFSSYFFFFILFFIFVVWIRSVLPRFRFDKLIAISWTFFIPFLTFYFLSFIFF